MAKKIELKVESAFMLDGKMRVKGDSVTVDERTARDLLRRGKAVLASGQDDMNPAAEGADDAPEKSGKRGGKKPGNQAKAADDGGAGDTGAES